MRTWYSIRLSGIHIAIADTMPDIVLGDGSYWLNRLSVPEKFRGKGFGSKLLDLVLKDADNLGVIMKLVASPDPMDMGLSRRELVSFYRRRGFIGSSRSVMVRLPVSKPIGEQHGKMARAHETGST